MPPNSQTEPSEIELAAGEWVARAHDPDFSAADRRRLELWLGENPRHREAYEAFDALWGDLDLALDKLEPAAGTRLGKASGLGAVSSGWRGTGGRGGARAQASARRTGFGPATATAAALAAAAFVAIYVARPDGGETLAIPRAVYETAMGEHENVRLDDGSVIELNAATRLEVAYSTDERRVTILEGAALFDVAHNPVRPFIVTTPRGDIIVRGTSFVVDIREDEVRTTVIRGVVEAEARSGGWNPLQSPARAIVRANEEAAFVALGSGARAGARVEVAALAPEITSRRLAWRDSMAAFDGETLAQAAAEITRQTGVTFEFADPALERERVGGFISVEDETDFVELLNASLQIDAEYLGAKHIRLSHRR